MKKRMIVTVCFLLVLFLASPLFGGLVGAIPLSPKEVGALRRGYPATDPFNPLMDYADLPHAFSREAQRADTLLYGEVLKAKQSHLYTTYTVHVLDTSRGGIQNGSRIELIERLGAKSQYLEVGERFAAAVWRIESEENCWETHPSSMFYVTEDGYVLSAFMENYYHANYDRKVHSGMTVQAFLRKYIAWDGVPSAGDFPWEERQVWLAMWGYAPRALQSEVYG